MFVTQKNLMKLVACVNNIIYDNKTTEA